MPPGATDLSWPHPLPNRVRLEFLTPLRLERNKHLLGKNELCPKELLLALARRMQQLTSVYIGVPEPFDWQAVQRAAERLEETRKMEWGEFIRYSTRQAKSEQTSSELQESSRKVAVPRKLGGMVGTWELRGDLTLIAPLLAFGELMHVGKATTFGLGRYRLVWDTKTPP